MPSPEDETIAPTGILTVDGSWFRVVTGSFRIESATFSFTTTSKRAILYDDDEADLGETEVEIVISRAHVIAMVYSIS
jgi:hypothetical protein